MRIPFALLAVSGVAYADDEPNKLTTIVISGDYTLGTYVDTVHKDANDMEFKETVTQKRYAVGIRLEVYDWRRKTPLGAVPGIWFDAQLGYIAPDDFSGERHGIGGEGGPLWDLRMSGPWKVIDNSHLRLGAGIGFRGGIEVGVPDGTNRLANSFAFDASLMSVADIYLAKLKLQVEGEYAVGLGYVEQRAYGHVAFGHLALGAQLAVGQADVNYFVFGLNLGIRGSKRE